MVIVVTVGTVVLLWILCGDCSKSMYYCVTVRLCDDFSNSGYCDVTTDTVW